MNDLADNLWKKFHAKIKILVKDLSLPCTLDEIFIELQRESIGVDVLVNNAGFGVYGFFSQATLQEKLEMLQVNVDCLTPLTKLFLGPMLQKGEGKIMNVASTATFRPGPLMAVYYATNAYVLSFSEALAEKLRGGRRQCYLFLPWRYAYWFSKKARIVDIPLLKYGVPPDAKTVAQVGHRALMAKKRVLTPELKNRIFAFGAKWIPRSLITRIVKQLQTLRMNKEE